MSTVSDRIVIALDVMGGDHAPDAILSGADRFVRTNKQIFFLLCGHESVLNRKLQSYPHLRATSEVLHAKDVIDNKERPSAALRKGKESSMRLAIECVRKGQAKAVVSAGNTGALMAMSKLILRTLPGIDRPAICSIFPTRKGRCVLLDLGANVDCNSDNLVQFAIMGDAFAKVILDLPRPTIGLLNVGEEDNKGSEIVKAASLEIREGGYNLNYYGFIEGNHIVEGIVDVVVTDGFTGNVALKSAEGTAKICADYIKQAFQSSPLAFLGGIFARNALKRVFKRMDPRMHNGAMFVGLNGIAVKSHGGTDSIGFCNAIQVAYDLAQNNINQKIGDELGQYDEVRDDNNDSNSDEELSDGQ